MDIQKPVQDLLTGANSIWASLPEWWASVASDAENLRTVVFVLAAVTLVLIVLPWTPSRAASSLRYFRANVFALILGGVSVIGLLYHPPKKIFDWAQPVDLWLAATIEVAVLLVAEPATGDFWQRYERTKRLASVPLLFVDSCLYAIIGGCAAFLSFSRLGFQDLRLPPALAVSAWAPLVLVVSIAIHARLSRQQISTKGGPSTELHSDAPIEDPAQDVLDRRQIVERLFSEISEFPFQESFTFGILGTWGSGKTSILNLLEKELRRRSDILLVEFNPWFHPSQNDLVTAFQSALLRSLRSVYNLGDVAGMLRLYLGMVSLSFRKWFLSFDTGDRQETDGLPRRLSEFLKTIDRRLVVLVDDLDRLQVDELLTTLKLIRLASMLPQITFLLSLDRQAVEKQFASRQIDNAYLDKIIQRPFVLPPLQRETLDQFVLFSNPDRLSAIDRLLDALQVQKRVRDAFDAEIVPFYKRNLTRIFRTLRDAKRFLNVFAGSIAPVLEDINIFDLFLLTILEVFYTAVYQDIWPNSNIYLEVRGLSLDVGSDRKTRAEAIKKHVQSIDGIDPTCEEILKKLFPQMEYALENMQYGISRPKMREEKRIGDPECFARYFMRGSSRGEVSDADVERFIEQLNDLSSR